MNNVYATPHPIDFDALEKDTTIDAFTLSKIVGCLPSEPHWQLKVLGLKEQIEKNTKIICRIIGETLRLCDDIEAAEYTNKEWKRGLRGMARNVERRSWIDTAEFSEQQRNAFDSNSGVMQLSTLAARNEYRKQRRLIAARCKTPGAKELTA